MPVSESVLPKPFLRMMGSRIAEHLNYDRERGTKEAIYQAFFELQGSVLPQAAQVDPSQWPLIAPSVYRSARVFMGQHRPAAGVSQPAPAPAAPVPRQAPARADDDPVIQRLDRLIGLVERMVSLMEKSDGNPGSSEPVIVEEEHVGTETTLRTRHPRPAGARSVIEESIERIKDRARGEEPIVYPKDEPPAEPAPETKEAPPRSYLLTSVPDITIMGLPEHEHRELKRTFEGRANLVFIPNRHHPKRAAALARGTYVLCHNNYVGLDTLLAVRKVARTFDHGLTSLAFRTWINDLLSLHNRRINPNHTEESQPSQSS